MNKYLLIKLAEEAGELVVAAVKYRLRPTKRRLAQLEGEVADVLAIVTLLFNGTDGRVSELVQERVKRERKRMTK